MGDKPWKTTVRPLNDEGTKWEIIVHLGWSEEKKRYDRRYKWIYATKEREIQAATRGFVREIEQELEAAEAAKAKEEAKKEECSQETIADWFVYWFNEYTPVFYEWEKNTRERAKRIINKNILPSLGHIIISQLESDLIANFYVKLAQEGKKVKTKDKDPEGNPIIKWVGLSKRTIKYVHTILNQSFDDAVTLKKIPANPAKGLKLPKDKEKHYSKWVVLDENQLWDFLSKTEGHRDYALIYTAAFTGARESELFGLKKDRLLKADRAIRVEGALHLDPDSPDGFEQRERTKNDTSTRTIPVTEDVIEVIEHHIAKQEENGIESDLIFTEPDGEPINRNNLGHRFSNLSTKLGYPGMTFHHLRHTHATILLSDGANINEVSERLGHAKPTITLSVYGHVLPGRMQSLAERFASLVKPKPPSPDPNEDKDNNPK
ncbi:MAG: tyrosine-type recombinase/integrase [Syntrophomonas sp.]